MGSAWRSEAWLSRSESCGHCSYILGVVLHPHFKKKTCNQVCVRAGWRSCTGIVLHMAEVSKLPFFGHLGAEIRPTLL